MERGRKAEEIVYSYIPEDIFLKILPKLPLNSLLRFRCVSKPWCYQISPYVRKSQKVIVPCSSAITPMFLSIDQSSQMEEIELEIQCRHWYKLNGVDDYIISRLFTTTSNENNVCGSCNGLLLISLRQYFFLWNPSDHISKRLALLNNFGRQPDVSGLCYDSQEGDYKVVLAFTEDTTNFGWGTEVLVGSSKSKTWKNVAFPWRVNLISHSPGTALHNNLHWLCRHKVQSLDEVICFNAKSDEFKYFPVPQSRQKQMLGLGVLDGCLSMCRWDEPFHCCRGNIIEVLIMKEYGVKGSWVSQFKFTNYLCNVQSSMPLFYTKDRKQVLVQIGGNRESEIVTYDIETNLCKPIKFLKEKAPRNTFVYEEAFTTHPNLLNKTETTSEVKMVQKVWQVIGKDCKLAIPFRNSWLD